MQPTLRVSFDKDPKPPLTVNSGELTVNVPLSFPEIIFASFVMDNMVTSLNAGCKYVFIGSKNLSPMQANYDLFLNKFFPKVNFLSGDRQVLPLITALWNQSRKFVNMKLVCFEKPAVEEESKQFIEATACEKGLTDSGYQGKMFTQRQIHFILDALKQTEKKGAEIKSQSS